MKKKNIFTFLLGIVCAVCGAVGFTACAPQPQEEEILLASFESYEELIRYHYLNYFGAAKPSKEYVTEGKGGAELTVNGRYSTAAKPTIVFDTKTDLIPKGDFSDVTEIKIDLRNDNAYAANIYLQYASVLDSGKKLSSAMRQTVEAGFAGTVTFPIDRGFISEFLDLTKVTEIRILFDAPKDAIPNLSSQEEALQNYRKFHVDNLRAVTATEEVGKEIVRKDMEIESGDREEYLAAWYMPTAYQFSPSSMSYNTDPAYIKGGSGSLKISLEGTNAGEAGEWFTPVWYMSVNQNADISRYGGIKFYMYNAEETDPINVYFKSPTSGKEDFLCNLTYGWNEIEVSLDDLENKYGFDSENFLLGFVFQARRGKDYAVYLDEAYAIPPKTPTVIAPVYEELYEMNAELTVKAPTLKNAKHYEVTATLPDGSKQTVSGNTLTLSQVGEYALEYVVKYVEWETQTEKTVSATATFSVVEGKTTFIEKPYAVVKTSALQDGAYLFTEDDKPDLELGGGNQALVTGYKVYSFNRNNVTLSQDGVFAPTDEITQTEISGEYLLTEDGALTGLKPTANLSYVIEYTLSAYGKTFTASKTLFFVDDTEKLSVRDLYPNFFTSGSLTGALTASADGMRISSDKGGATADGEWSNPVYLGDVKNMLVLFRNDGATDVFVYFYGAPDSMAVRVPVKAKQYVCLDFSYADLMAWGFIGADGTFGGSFGEVNKLKMTVYSPSGAFSVTLCDMWLNADAVNPDFGEVRYGNAYTAGEKVAIVAPKTVLPATYTVTVTKEGVTEPTFTCTQEDVGTDKGTFTVGQGRFTLTYTLQYVVNGETVTLIESYAFIGEFDPNSSAFDGLLQDKWTDLDGMY